MAERIFTRLTRPFWRWLDSIATDDYADYGEEDA